MLLPANPIRNGFCLRTAAQLLATIALSMPLGSLASAQVQTGVSSGAVNIPQTNLVPVAPPPAGRATSGLGQFDPYATNPTPSLGGGSSLLGPSFSPGGSPVINAPPPVINAPPPVINAPPPIINAPPSTGGSALTQIGPPSAAAPPVVIAPPTAGIAPSPPGSSLFSRIFSRPASTQLPPGFGPTANTPTFGPQGGLFDSYGQSPGMIIENPNVYGPATGYSPPPGYASPPGTLFPSTAYPSSTPSTLFPEGIFSSSIFGGYPEGQFSAYRLLQGPRLRHAFVSGGKDPIKLGMHETDTSFILAFPNFLYSTQPLYVIPSFSLYLWDGPDGNVVSADLPSQAYAGFLDFGWNSDPNRMVGTELGVRVGVWTDFNTYNSKSLRVLGKGLFTFRLSPFSTFKGGVYYIDRNKIKLIPAAGFLCQPNPSTRIDLFFPQPKFARYWRTIGTKDVWWYFSGDYGGGSWTIRRTNLTEDSVDINDLRAIFGVEWGGGDEIRAGRRTGFAEVGYVFEREVEYRFNPLDNFKPKDGIMVRLGIGY